jgi:hypothetical protein
LFPVVTCLKTNVLEQRHQNLQSFVFVSYHPSDFKI